MKRYLALVGLMLVLGTPRVWAQSETTTGTLAKAGDAVSFTLVGIQSETIQLTGAWAGTAVIEATNDNGTTWQAVPAANVTTGAPTLAASVNSLVVLQNAGYTAARVRMATYGSGTATVTATRGFGALILPPCNLLLRAAGACK